MNVHAHTRSGAVYHINGRQVARLEGPGIHGLDGVTAKTFVAYRTSITDPVVEVGKCLSFDFTDGYWIRSTPVTEIVDVSDI